MIQRPSAIGVVRVNRHQGAGNRPLAPRGADRDESPKAVPIVVQSGPMGRRRDLIRRVEAKLLQTLTLGL